MPRVFLGQPPPVIAAVRRRLGVHVVLGLLEVAGDKLFNACALMGESGVIGSYRKAHLPFLGVDRFTTPGDQDFKVHEITVGGQTLRIGMKICYDASFPESSRVVALLGADLIVLPTNWPPGSEYMSAYVVNSRALENHVYYLAANRVGSERGFHFIGQSKICAPGGHLLCPAPHNNEGLLLADIDVDHARQKRQVIVPGKHEVNRVSERRPKLYGVITQPLHSGTGSEIQANRDG